MALWGALHGKQPGRKVVFREVDVLADAAKVESFNDELISVDDVQLAFVTVQTIAGSVHASAQIAGTDVTVLVQGAALGGTPSTVPTTMMVRAYGQAPA